MNKVFSDLKLFTCNAHPELAKEIAELMGIKSGKSTVNKFSDGEIQVSIWESVRDCDVYIVQPTCAPVNDNLMELLIMIDALKRASAGRINAVIPYYGYARQDRKAKARDPITAKLVANLIQAALSRWISTPTRFRDTLIFLLIICSVCQSLRSISGRKNSKM